MRCSLVKYFFLWLLKLWRYKAIAIVFELIAYSSYVWLIVFFISSDSPNLDNSSVSFDEIMVSLATVCSPHELFVHMGSVFAEQETSGSVRSSKAIRFFFINLKLLKANNNCSVFEEQTFRGLAPNQSESYLPCVCNCMHARVWMLSGVLVKRKRK